MSMDNVEIVTVGQLRSLLDDYDDDMPVGIGYQYGDYHRSTGVVVPSVPEEKHVKWSANLRSIIVDEGGHDNEDEESEVWLILED